MKHPCVQLWSSLGQTLSQVIVVALVSLLELGAADTQPESSTGPIPKGVFHKLRVEDNAVSQELQAKGARLIADYGNYQLLEAPHDAAKEYARHAKVSVRDEENIIELHARKLNTAQAEVQAQRQAVADFMGKKLHLVHFAGPVKPEWHAQLKAHGAEIVAYVPHNAYLVYGDASALKKLQGHAKSAQHVQWEGDYLDDYKIHPDAKPVDQKGKPPQLPDNLFAIQMVADEAANAETIQLVEGLKLEPVRKKERVLHYQNVIVRLPTEKLADIAARPDVVSIQPYVVPKLRDERQDQIVAGNLSGTSPNGPGYLAWLASKGFTQEQFGQSGFVVDVSDSGIDNGTTTPGHFGLYPLGNVGLPSRVAYNRLEGRANYFQALQGCDGHGTINAHIVAGYNDRAGFPFTDMAGYSYGLGVTPFVRVGSSVVFDPWWTFPNFADLQSRAYRDGARVSANSWGAEVFGQYNIESQAYDALVRNAQPASAAVATPSNQEMVIVFAAGNDGPESISLCAPGTAKNIISVGATENVHSHSLVNGGNSPSGEDRCRLSDEDADSADDIARFSSRGPCSDGRFKPDLVAPGTHITGGVPQENSAGPLGTALACFDSTGVCGLSGEGAPGGNAGFFPLGQQFYTTSSGTSHSCPAVAGGTALLRQYFISQNWAPPSPAMTKAWLMNSARYLAGEGASDTLPSQSQGMGGMNLGMAFDSVARYLRDQVLAEKFTASGQRRAFTGTIADTNQPFRVTLAWTDAPGAVFAAAYNNDLDLTVLVGGQSYHGNVFAGAVSVPGGTADWRNNVESVFLPAGTGGPFTVLVTAANISSDGVPNNADPLDQDFALVIYNAQSNSLPVLAAGAATLIAEGCNPANGAIDPGEAVTVSLALTNFGGAPTTNLVAALLPAGGVTRPSSPRTYGALTNGSPSISQEFSFVAVGSCGGTVTASLRLTDGDADLGTVTFPLPLGSRMTLSNSHFTRPGMILIPAAPTVAEAMPYPSPLHVTGLTGTISKITVTLSNLSHSFASDVDALLIGPQGQGILLMSDAGGGNGMDSVTLTFDDEALETLPTTLITSGTYKPTAYRLGDFYYDQPIGNKLAVFRGTDPNGTWDLCVADLYDEDEGAMVGGWAIDITTAAPSCCANPAYAEVALTITASPDPVPLDGELTYSITVSNRGPAAATNLRLTDDLPGGVRFTSATASSGNCAVSNGTVFCTLGDLLSHAVATVSITVTVIESVTLTNTAKVASDSFDYNPVSLCTPVTMPQLAIADSAVTEGNSGTTNLVFQVTLHPPTMRTVTVEFATADVSAIAGRDYRATNGTLLFRSMETSKQVSVLVFGDGLWEPDEQLKLKLFNPVNASVPTAEGVGTILNDDPKPSLRIEGGSVVEGDTGTTNAVITLALDGQTEERITVRYVTGDGSALAGVDYLATNGAVTLMPGQTTTNIAVTVIGDTENEPDETFRVYLSSTINAVVPPFVDCTILTDDARPRVTTDSPVLLAESMVPTNGMVDPGETVTVGFALRNVGWAATTNATVTLLAEGGVSAPSSPQNYGALAVRGPAVVRPFTFTATGIAGTTISARLHVADGPVDLGTLQITLPVGSANDFAIINLTTNSAFAVKCADVLTGSSDSLAVSSNYLFITSVDVDWEHFQLLSLSGQFSAADLSGGRRLAGAYLGLVGNLRSEAVYCLADGDSPLGGYSDDSVTSLLEVDGNTGELTGNRITLSTPIRARDASYQGYNCPGIFAGYDCVVIHNGARVYRVSLPWGAVTDLGAMSVPEHTQMGWAFWGVAENHESAVHLVYVKDTNTIVRTRVPDGLTTSVSSFTHLGGVSAISVSPSRNRWYFHAIDRSQFYPGPFVVEYAQAILSQSSTNSPTILVQPRSQTVATGFPVSFSVEVSGNWPWTYQWRKDGTDLAGATNASLIFAQVQTNDTGNYDAVVVNAFGSVVSSHALLTVAAPQPNLYDDFDPGIDPFQWLGFGAEVLATNYGGKVSGVNSLWFGGEGQRYALTRPLDTSLGGVVRFHLRIGDGGGYPWEQADLPEEGIVLEYSTDGGTHWTNLGTYDTPNYYSWSSETVVLPPGAQSSQTHFRWRQLKNSGACCDHWALDDVAIVVGPQPPVIAEQPASKTMAQRTTAIVSVKAAGSGPLFYQWWKEGLAIAGATNASLVISNLQSSDAGRYSLTVTSALGSVLSSNALVTVVEALPGLFDDFEPGVDLTQWTGFAGTVLSASLIGSVSGSNALWFGCDTERCAVTRFVDTPLGGSIEFFLRFNSKGSECGCGADDPEEGLMVEYSTDGGDHWVEIAWYGEDWYNQRPTEPTGLPWDFVNWRFQSLPIPSEARSAGTLFRWRLPYHNGYCHGAWALDDIAIRVEPRPPWIAIPPANQTVAYGASVTFEVMVTGSAALNYQWQKEGVDIAGATNASITIGHARTTDDGRYSVRVWNTHGTVVSSDAALTVVPPEWAVAVFGDPDYVDYWADEIPQHLQASLQRVGLASTLITNLESAAQTYRHLVMPVLRCDLLAHLTAAERVALSNHVAGGGTLIVHGGYYWQSGVRLINAVFGLGLVEIRTGVSRFNRTSQAEGTTFADGPTLLPDETEGYPNFLAEHTGVLLTSSLPPGARSIYENAEQSPVTMIEWGRGLIIYLGWDWDDAAPMSIFNGGWLGVLRSAVTQPSPVTPSAPVIVSQPASRTTGIGMSATFTVRAIGTGPLHYQWQKDGTELVGATNDTLVVANAQPTDAGSYGVVVSNAYGSVSSDVASLAVKELSAPEFQILTLSTTGSRVVEHRDLTGDDWAGIAASTSQVFYSGRKSTARFALTDLSGGTALGRAYLALVSDLQSGKMYSLGCGNTPLTNWIGPVTCLLEHDSTTGELTGNSIALSPPVFLQDTVGLFAGYGRAVIQSQEKVYDILLPSGVVIERGAMSFYGRRRTESWTYWGVAEYTGGTLYLVYVKDVQTIVRSEVPSGTTTTLASFTNLSDMAAFTVSMPQGRWYFHYQGNGQFGGQWETLGYADAVFSLGSSRPPVIQSQPASRTVPEGGATSFRVTAAGSSPLRYQWHKDGIALTEATNATLIIAPVQTNDAGNYSVIASNAYSSVTSAVATLTVIATPTGDEFQIVDLSTNGSRVVSVSGYALDSIAASGGQLFCCGREFSLPDLVNQSFLGRSFDALVSDLRSGTTYLLAEGPNPITASGGTVTRLLELDGQTGELTGSAITLSEPISLLPNGGQVGIFAGYGRVVLHTGSRVYDILLRTGQVIDRGSMLPTAHARSYTWAYWGVAEHFGGNLYLVCVRDPQTIVRTAVPSGESMTLARFTNLSDMSSFTVSIPHGRWYFYYNYGRTDGQFGGEDDTIGCAGAAFNLGETNPPVILNPPVNRTVAVGGTAHFTVMVSGGLPLIYQWRRDGVEVAGATNASLLIVNAQTNDAGNYSLWVTNAYGSAFSSNAVLVVVDPGTNFFDDFDPGIDLAQWSVFSGTVFATNVAGSVSGLNSLWFGGNDARFAITRPLNTSAGGVIQFYLRMACGGSFPWEQVDLPEEGIVLESSIDGGLTWARLGTYDTINYFEWRRELVILPPEAQSTATYFRWRQLGHSGELYDHWALDDVSFPAIGLSTNLPPLRLELPRVVGGGWELWLGNADGSPVVAERVERIQAFSTTNLLLPFSNWTQLLNPLVLTNGLLRLEGLDATNAPQRFFRAVESP